MDKQFSKATGILRFIVLAAIGTGITLAAGLLHGRLTQRWGPLPDLQAAARNLEALPKDIGDWQSVKEEPISERIVQTLSCAGYVNRQYVNRKTGQTISVAIIVGPPGPTAVHTPEICYSSRAYSIQDPRKEVKLSDDAGKSHSFWSVQFRSSDASPDQLHVYYGWLGDGEWTASKSPRFEFAGRRLLHKLQMSTIVPAQRTDRATDPCQDFLTALLRSNWSTNG